MDQMPWLARFAIALILLWVALKDVKERRIPNFASVSLFFGALIYSWFAPSGGGVLDGALPGSPGIKQLALSIGVAFSFGFVLFALRLWGAGDAKLIIGLAAWMLWTDLVKFFFLICVAGGCLAMVRIFLKGNSYEVIGNIKLIVLSKMSGLASPKFESADRMPFSIAIGAGWGALMFLKVGGFW
jgi:prepilin peptidase CpaA